MRNAPQVAPRCVRHPDQGHGWAHRIRTVHKCRPHQLCAGQGPATAPATYPVSSPALVFLCGFSAPHSADLTNFAPGRTCDRPVRLLNPHPHSPRTFCDFSSFPLCHRLPGVAHTWRIFAC